MKQKLKFEESGELTPLPDRLPASVESRIGEVEFRRGLPTRNGIAKLVDIQDFQRACQLYQWAIPAVGIMGWHKANLANGATGQTDWVLFDEAGARSGLLTPDGQVAYVLAFPDLEVTGPLILDYSAGKIAGYVMDYWQRPLSEFGHPGPERGATSGKLLLLPPRQKPPEKAAGLRAVRSPTRVAAVVYRVLNRGEVDRYTPHNRLYAFGNHGDPPPAKVIVARKPFTQSQPRGLVYWEWLHELIQREPVHERDRLFLGMLRSLGIEKGKPFDPDDRLRQILEDAVSLGEQMARVLVHEKPAVSHCYREGTRWQHAILLDPYQRQDTYDEFDERTRFFYESFGSPHVMRSSGPGLGWACLVAYRDEDGDWLDGSMLYRLRVPADPPARQSWVLAAYDLDTRNPLAGDPLKTEICSSTMGLKKNDDGSVDVFVGPAPPEGSEANWIRTRPGHFWYAYFRLAAPTQTFFDCTWMLPDLENVTSPLKGWWATLSRPTRLALRVRDRTGFPTAGTDRG